MKFEQTMIAASIAAAISLCASTANAAVSVTALPTGGAVVSGAATLTQGTNILTVSGTGNNVITYAGGFNVGSGATVTFNGGNFLNVDQSGAASEIDGTINGNATGVFIANANGIVVGNGASINLTAAGGANGGGNFGLAAQDLSGNAQVSGFMSSGTMPVSAVNSSAGASVSIGSSTIVAGSVVVNANGNIFNTGGSITASSSGGVGALTLEAGNQLQNYGVLVDNSAASAESTQIASNYGAQINLIAHGAGGPYNLSLVNQPTGVIQTNGSVNLVAHVNMLNYGTVTANATSGMIAAVAGNTGVAGGSIYGGTKGSFSAPSFYFKYGGDIAGGIVENSINPQPGNAFDNGFIVENSPASSVSLVYLLPSNIGAARQNINLISPTNSLSILPGFTAATVNVLAGAASGAVNPSFVPSNLFVRAPAVVGLYNQNESGAGSTFYWPGLMYIENTQPNSMATPYAATNGGIVMNAGVTTISNVIPNPAAGLGIYFLAGEAYNGTGGTVNLDATLTLRTNAGSSVNLLPGWVKGTAITAQISTISGAAATGLASLSPISYMPPAM